jgi:uncharacterized protein (DUF486 family)
VIARKEFWLALLMLLGSNVFMTFAWYGHLKFKHKALALVIVASWAIAFFEYCLQVPANRIGSSVMAPSQLKVMQEAITFTVFFVFSIFYLQTIPTFNDVIAFLLILCGVAVAFLKPL